MSNTVNWGILGAANFALNHMGPAIHAANNAKLVALATGSKHKDAPFQALCPDLKIHDSYDALLADPDIDAVYIPLPNHLHVEWSLKALEAGKHVLCEKPMTLQAGEFDTLIDARDQTGLLAAEAFMIVHHPQWHYVRELIQSGEIGRLVHVSGIFAFDSREDVENIRHRPETGGGALRDIGVYVLGSTRFVTGEEPQDISSRIRWENDVDAFTDIQASFPGFTYSAYVTTRLNLFQEMTFHGEGGLIRVTAPFNPRIYGEASVELHKDGRDVSRRRFPIIDQYKLQVEAFGDSATTGSQYPCPLEFSKETQVAIDQAFDNSRDI
ncbi:Gfo/Idh/MocA family protein [Ruegeria atlantica]|uniref:Gfo/Idh/MocA family protein n=1 Tax=Ruegeria atlantica TaxID=81569 RepID=UPI001479AEC5|nr:Gfo/Idh/MocA family oxidoreductase [Ruegeria atlantica]